MCLNLVKNNVTKNENIQKLVENNLFSKIILQFKEYRKEAYIFEC